MSTTHLLARGVIRRDGRVLVVQADGQANTFLPGGHVEEGEGVEACLRRELREELGVEVEIGSYRGTVEHRWTRAGEVQYELNHCFSVEVPELSPEAQPVSREAYLTFNWVPVDQLEEVHLQPAPFRRFLRVDEAGPWWGSTLPSSQDQTEYDSERGDAVEEAVSTDAC